MTTPLISENLFFDLLIIDDIYPSAFSPFRTHEYNHYLWFFNSAALSLEGWHLWVENNNFDEHLTGLDERLRARVFKYSTHSSIAARLAYVTFLKNAVRLLPYFESRQLPFILQLYPGGGFAIDIDETDAELRAVLLHPLCRKVITTQTISKNYVLDKIGCDPKKVEFVFGGVFDSNVEFDYREKKLFGRDKDTLDLCFVAHKYGDDVKSKGYDYFVDLAKRLHPQFRHLKFHVVGNYRANDIDLWETASAFTFYGRQPQSFFADFYPRMDAIVSFNRPFVLTPGTFDGFPTGACLEAAFRGVANFVNDPLDLNIEFQSGRDLLLLDDDFDTSTKQIEDMLTDPPRLAALGEGSFKAFRRVMDIDRQLWARTKIIADELHKHEALVMVPTAPASRVEKSGIPSPEVEALKTTNRAHEGHVTDLLRHINSLEMALANRKTDAAPAPASLLRRLRNIKQLPKWGKPMNGNNHCGILIRRDVDRFGHNDLFADEISAALENAGWRARIVDYIANSREVFDALKDRNCKFFLTFNGFGTEILMPTATPGRLHSAFEVFGRPVFDLMHDCPLHETMSHQLRSAMPGRRLMSTDVDYAWLAKAMGVRDVLPVATITFPHVASTLDVAATRDVEVLFAAGLSSLDISRDRIDTLTAKGRIFRTVFDEVAGVCISDWSANPITELMQYMEDVGLATSPHDEEFRFLLSVLLDHVKFARRHAMLEALEGFPVTLVTDREPEKAMSNLTVEASRSARDLLSLMHRSKVVICPSVHALGYHERPFMAFTAGAAVVAAPNGPLQASFSHGKEFYLYQDRQSLRDAVEASLDNPDVSLRGRQKALASFSPGRLVDTILNDRTLRP